MKKLILTITLALVVTLTSYAQPPQAFNYQAVVRDNSGEILQNQNVGIRISIHDETTLGTIVYQETFSETTNDFGLVNLQIGNGTPTIGTFTGIEWGSNSKFLEIEIDTAGGSNYTTMGTSELLSVPYAMFAEDAAVADDGDWTTTGNDIYSANSGKVGIGTSNPEAKLMVKAPNGFIGNSSLVKGLIIKDGYFNIGNEFEILDYYDNPRFRVLDNGYTVVGADSKGIQMRTDGSAADIESLGTDLAINYQTGNNTLLNVTSGNVGIGINNPSQKVDIRGSNIVLYAENTSNGNYAYLAGTQQGVNGNSQTGAGVIGYSGNYIGVFANSPDGRGLYAQSFTDLAGDFAGDVNITGTLSKGSGSFVIDHPLDPENKLLRHNFVESPENLLIYRGKARLNSNGETIVELPDYFEALTKENEATVVLTSIGKPFLSGYEWESDFNSFKIYGEPGRDVSWVVYADRDDPVINELGRPVEEEKGPDNKLCDKGKLLYPKAYGYPETMGRNYEEMVKMKRQIKKE